VGEAEELRTGSVIRLAKVSDDFPPDSQRPRPEHFEPSTPEREIEERTGALLRSVSIVQGQLLLRRAK